MLVLALRLFDLVLREKGVAETARELMPWSMSGLLLTLVTGTLLFTSEAVKCWGNVAFHYKALFLLLALPFQFTALRSVTRADRQGLPPIVRKLTALVAVLLWFGVAVFGRAIFFFCFRQSMSRCRFQARRSWRHGCCSSSTSLVGPEAGSVGRSASALAFSSGVCTLRRWPYISSSTKGTQL